MEKLAEAVARGRLSDSVDSEAEAGTGSSRRIYLKFHARISDLKVVHNADATITVGDEVLSTPEDLVGKTVIAFRGEGGAVVLAGHSVAAAGVVDDDGLLERAKVHLFGCWAPGTKLASSMVDALYELCVVVVEIVPRLQFDLMELLAVSCN